MIISEWEQGIAGSLCLLRSSWRKLSRKIILGSHPSLVIVKLFWKTRIWGKKTNLKPGRAIWALLTRSQVSLSTEQRSRINSSTLRQESAKSWFSGRARNRTEWRHMGTATVLWPHDALRSYTQGGASLVVQWLRSYLTVQGTQAQSLIQEDSTLHGATKPEHQNYWATTTEPVHLDSVSHKRSQTVRGPRIATRE